MVKVQVNTKPEIFPNVVGISILLARYFLSVPKVVRQSFRRGIILSNTLQSSRDELSDDLQGHTTENFWWGDDAFPQLAQSKGSATSTGVRCHQL